MDEKQVIDLVRKYLTQIALELEEAAAGARNAAKCLHDHNTAWIQVQQMYARLDQANHLVSQFQKTIDEAIAGAVKRS